MGAEIVNRKFDRFARIQTLEMIDQEIVIERVRMIEVRSIPIIQRHILQIAIIEVLLNKDDFVGAHRFQNAIGDRGLA